MNSLSTISLAQLADMAAQVSQGQHLTPEYASILASLDKQIIHLLLQTPPALSEVLLQVGPDACGKWACNS